MKEPEEHILRDSCGKEINRIVVGRDRFINLQAMPTESHATPSRERTANINSNQHPKHKE